MTVPTSISDLTTSEATNSPADTESITATTRPSDYIRAHAAIIKTLGNTVDTFSHRNVLINGGFTINQRAYVSGAVLASGSYGHDRWKAGAGGGDYSFTQGASSTTITIAANKTLIQVIEDKNVHSATYKLSWTGTALARVGIDSATPSGAYAASPITITTQTPGTTMSVEFGNGASTGTLVDVHLEAGAVVTPFEDRPYGTELALCYRYARPFPKYLIGQAVSTSSVACLCELGTPMRTTPTATSGTYSATAATGANAAGTLSAITLFDSNIRFDLTAVTGSPLVAGNASIIVAPAGALLTAEL